MRPTRLHASCADLAPALVARATRACAQLAQWQSARLVTPAGVYYATRHPTGELEIGPAPVLFPDRPAAALTVKRIEPAEWGPPMWRAFHEALAMRPLEALGRYVAAFEEAIPCGECKTHFRGIAAKIPPTLATRDEARAWGVAVHNAVNRDLGKPEMPLEAALAAQEAATRLFRAHAQPAQDS